MVQENAAGESDAPQIPPAALERWQTFADDTPLQLTLTKGDLDNLLLALRNLPSARASWWQPLPPIPTRTRRAPWMPWCGPMRWRAWRSGASMR